MINYFCKKRLKANIVELRCFVCNFKLFGGELCSSHKIELKNSKKSF